MQTDGKSFFFLIYPVQRCGSNKSCKPLLRKPTFVNPIHATSGNSGISCSWVQAQPSVECLSPSTVAEEGGGFFPNQKIPAKSFAVCDHKSYVHVCPSARERHLHSPTRAICSFIMSEDKLLVTLLRNRRDSGSVCMIPHLTMHFQI